MQPQILAVGGGKGGTGKSVLTVQLGIGLAQLGHKILLIDGDPHGPNLHTFFGLEDPEVSMECLLDPAHTPDDAVLPTGFERLGLVAGFRKEPMPPATPEMVELLLARLSQVEAEIVLIDTGSGCGLWQTGIFAQAPLGLLVVAPEPTCLEREYRFLRQVCRYRLASETIPQGDWLPVPWLAGISRRDPEHAHALQHRLQQQALLVVINQARTLEDQALGNEILLAARRFLGLTGQAIGWIEYDERLWLAVRHRRPAILDYPDSTLAEQLQTLTLRLRQRLQGEEA